MTSSRLLLALLPVLPHLAACLRRSDKLHLRGGNGAQERRAAVAVEEEMVTADFPPPQFESRKPIALVRLNEEEALKRGAVCLDGSVPGLYFEPAKDPSAATKWVLFIKGGGWCANPTACANRYRTSVGSSKYFPAQLSTAANSKGYLDSHPLENPTFHNFNRVILRDCGGGFFASDREDAVSAEDPDDPSKNVSLWFRGRRMLDFMLEELQGPRFGMDAATEVLFGGSSAGGLATYLLADYVAERMPQSVTKFRAAPVSGFMTAHLNATGGIAFTENMQLLAELQNATGAPGCAAAMPEEERWRCVLANYSYAYSTTPFFLMQSVLDAQNVMHWGNLQVQKCAATNFEQCGPEDLHALNTMYRDFMIDLRSTEKYFHEGEGGFVETCGLHMGQLGAGFNSWKVRETTPNQALTRWWDRNSSFRSQWYLPCTLGNKPPHQCNPSCRPSRAGPPVQHEPAAAEVGKPEAQPQPAAARTLEPPPQFESLRGTPLPLVMLNEERALERGAVCLDGSTPGVYFQPAKDPSAATKWVLFIKSVEWCANPKHCANVSRASAGSSKHFPQSFPPVSQEAEASSFNGYMDADPLENPAFHNFNRVILWSCDGGLFASDREDPVSAVDPADPSKNVSLWFRGRRVLDFMLEELQGPEFGMSNATEVLLGGSSAGGHATYLLADYVATQLPASVMKFRAAPVSGLMTAYFNATGGLGHIADVRQLAKMHNATGAPGCVAAMPEEERWKCMLANYSYAYSQTPFFLMQSVLDAQNVKRWGGAQVHACAASNYEHCALKDVRTLRKLYRAFMFDLRSTTKYFAAGEGGFVETCGLHAGQFGVGFNKWKVLETTPNQALTLWWQRPSSFHNQWYLPCQLGEKPPYQCNPSCRPPRQ